MISRILVGHDDTAGASAAFAFAIDLARHYDAELHVLSVARPPKFGEEVETEAFVEQATGRIDASLAELRAAARGVDVRFDVATGHPADQLVLYAEQHGIDHLVVGHRGHAHFDELFVSSVARRLIAHAPCGVSIIGPGAPPAGSGSRSERA